ncbi:hypothetical protein MK409_06405 [Streptococcus oralis]|jgi:hypothetical protein|uniref:hypothetical protein n=1 Tax=Streptococcus oralis TaxID=1303 RepID=UPI002284E24B|nr:hypothetical protein [Streptococcus oralis]MCY7097700.1 hypothetical protein [Streptococcus oralis]
MSELEKNPANDELVEKVTEQTPELTETIEQGHKEDQPNIEEESKSDQVVEPKQEGISLQTLLQTKRKEIIAVLAIVALAIVAFVGYNIYDSQPKSIIDEVKVQFSGYEETGKLTYNSEEIASKIEELSYRKAGFNNNQAKALAQKDPVAYSEVSRNPKLAAMLQKAEAMITSVQFNFDRTSELKNGDEVTFTITTNSQSAAVKAEKKTFKVADLKEYEKVSTADLLKETPVTFTGFNGYGIASITEKPNKDGYFNFEDNKRPTNLKNGDTVTLTVSVTYINELKSKGKVVDNNKVEVTVEGLKDLKDVKNFADLLKKNDDYSKSEHQNSSFSTYTLESQGSYLKVIPEENKKSNGKVSLITVYKVTWSSGNSKEVRYKYYGYQAYLLKDGNLDLDAASKVSSWGSKDLEGLKAELATEGYKVFEEKKSE